VQVEVMYSQFFGIQLDNKECEFLSSEGLEDMVTHAQFTSRQPVPLPLLLACSPC